MKLDNGDSLIGFTIVKPGQEDAADEENPGETEPDTDIPEKEENTQ